MSSGPRGGAATSSRIDLRVKRAGKGRGRLVAGCSRGPRDAGTSTIERHRAQVQQGPVGYG